MSAITDFDPAAGALDITGAENVEVEIRNDGRVVWVNAPNMRLRICQIRGRVRVNDRRRMVQRLMAAIERCL